MVTQKTDLAKQQSFGTHLRFMPKSALQTFRIKAGTELDLIPGTPFSRDADGTMVPFVDGVEIHCILWDRQVKRLAAGEVLATFMVDGEFAREDLQVVDAAGDALPGTITEAGLDTACRSVELVKLGFRVQGLSGTP